MAGGGYQRGATPSGVTGLIDVSGTPQFWAQVTAHAKNGSVRKIVRTGRGNTGFETTRSATEAAYLTLKFKATPDGFLEPVNLRDASGTVTIQYHIKPDGTTPIQIAYPVTVEADSLTYDMVSKDDWVGTLKCTVTGLPVSTGWPGTQITPTPPVLTDIETYQGLQKIYDTNGLLTAAIQRIDVVNVADTDAAEDTKLAAVVAAATSPPMTYLKVVTATFERTDKLGGTIVIQWGLQDSKDQVETPQNIVTTDPNDLNSETSSATVYTTGSPPSNPALPSGQKLVDYVDKKLNDQKTVRIYRWAKNDSKDDYQLPVTYTVADSNNLLSVASGGTIDGTPSTPGGYVLRTTKVITVKTGHTFTTREFGLRTTAEDIERPETHNIVDPSGLKSRARAAKVGGTPSLPAGYVERETDTYNENSLAQIKIISGGLRTTIEDITFPGTWAKLDPLAIDSVAVDTDVYLASGGVPSPPSPPSAELQIVSTKIEQETELMSKRTVEFEVLNSQQKRLYPKIKTYDDAQNIEDSAVRAQYWAVGDTPPALPTDVPANNVKLIGFTDIPDTPALNIRIWVYGEKNSRDDVVQPHYETTADASNLEATAVRACLDGESISDPSGYTLRFTKTIPLTFSLGVNRTLTIKIYGLRTVANDLQMPETWTVVDIAPTYLDATHQLDGHGQKLTVYTTSGGVPSDPSPPSGLQIVGSKIMVQNDITSAKTWEFAVNNAAQKIIFPASRSIRSAQTPYLDLAAVIYNCLSTDTNLALANTYWAAHQGDANIWSIELERLTAVLVKVVVTYRDPGILVFEETFGENTSVFVDGTSGSAKVCVSDVWSRGSTSFWVALSMIQVNQVVREFSITRQYTGNSFMDFTSLENHTNDATFLGLGAGKVMYTGAEMKTNIGLSSTFPFSAIYHFRYCSNAFYSVSGWQQLFMLGSNPGTGLQSASSCGVTATAPSTGDFSVFLGSLP